jgi:hypothetical protein
MVHAEKILTAVYRASANTRWRDFADTFTLARRHDIDGDQLIGAMAAVARHRAIDIAPLREVLDGYVGLAQPRWAAWRRKQRLDDQLPEQFAEVLEAVISFADPALMGVVAGRSWDARRLAWR